MTNLDLGKEQEFIKRVEGLSTGELAGLRRGCGKPYCGEGRCCWFEGVIWGAAKGPAAFLVASLLAQYKTSVIKQGGHALSGDFEDFGKTWRRAVADREGETMRKRFLAVLDAEFDPHTGAGDLPYRLRQMVKYAASKGFRVNWALLLQDLGRWNYADKRVQKRWARSFFEHAAQDSETDTTKTED